MEIRLRDSGRVVSEGEFRALFPNTSLPNTLNEELLDSLGGDIVFEGPQATNGTVYQYSMRDGVELRDGKWFTRYVLGPLFSDPIEEQEYKNRIDNEKAASVRSYRNTLLSATDWTQAKDIPDTVSSPFAEYRQQLRDVPLQEGFPWTVTWPEKPFAS